MQRVNGQKCIRPIAVWKIARLILKTLYRTENTLSGAWFCELLSDWYKTFCGSQYLVSGHKVKKSVITHNPTQASKMRGIA